MWKKRQTGSHGIYIITVRFYWCTRRDSNLDTRIRKTTV